MEKYIVKLKSYNIMIRRYVKLIKIFVKSNENLLDTFDIYKLLII